MIEVRRNLLFTGLLILPLCGCQPAAEDSAADAGSAVANPADPQTLAMQAKDELFQRLSGRLTEVMQGQGPVAAIRVCSQEAQDIAQQVGEKHGVRIGRTSLRLRNSANRMPAWAEDWVAANVAEPHMLDLPGGELGALFPIPLQPKCVMCHGPKQQLAEPIQQQLASLYPDDSATGYSEGDLRGWFWVEVPR
ncbi:MAG: DUF3365 domain-containing protein [bacterium]|nr:DUF3365 domain-containing protein [bacterium]